MPSDTTPLIIVTVDGLRASALGAYGQTSYGTPALDAFAAEATTYEWAYAPTDRPTDLFARLFDGAPPLRDTCALVTDDADLAADDSLFASRRLIEVTKPTKQAGDIDQTTAAAVWASFAEAAVEAFGDAESTAPPVLWLHTRGLYGPWDAPAELFAPMLDEDDPEVVASVDPPDERPEESDAADARFAAGCRYASEVMTLDACFAGWLDVVDAIFEGVDHRVAIAGVRGFPLGEHEQIGGYDPRLFSETQHLPLFVRGATPSDRFTRVRECVPLDRALLSLLAGAAGASPTVVMQSPGVAGAAVTGDWMLRRPDDGDPELYVKPDDRWEQNDVASLEPDTVEELLSLLPRGGSGEYGVAAPAEAL